MLGFENTQSFRTLTSLVPLAIGGILSLTAVIIATKKWERENLRVLHAKEMEWQRTASGLQMQLSERRTLAEAVRQTRAEASEQTGRWKRRMPNYAASWIK